MKDIKEILRKYKIWIGIMFCSILVGIVGEFFYNLPVNKQDDYSYFAVEDVVAENFSVIEGNKFSSTEGTATLTLSFDKQYVDKLRYDFDWKFGQSMRCEIIVQTYEDGETPGQEVIYDNNNYTLKSSTVNIRRVTDKITIKLNADGVDAKISNIAINNTENYSEVRILFVAICTFIILGLGYCWIKRIEIRLERIFLVLCLTVGTLGIYAMPTHKVGLDEEIHFGRTYFLWEALLGEETITYPYGIEELRTASLSNWPYHLPQSEEERKEEDEYRDVANDYLLTNPEETWTMEKENKYQWNLYSITYIFQWLMLKIGMLLQLPFTIVFKMGRMGNLLLYAAVMYFAIKHLTVGKRIMFILALMPTNMLTAMTYSYDAWVNAFSFLGMSYLLEAWFGEDKTISYKNFTIMVLSFVFASLPKAVYIPLLALGLLLPKNKFRNKKDMYAMKSIMCVAIVMMLSTFVLPALINPVQLGGDSRGGDTSVARQLQYIFSHPLYYTKLLLTSIKDTFFSYSIGTEGMARMGHYQTLVSSVWIMIVVCYTVFTDGCYKMKNKLCAWQRGAIFVVCFGVICLIWTALYLSFTPVGAQSIAGVQGRYYLPVTIWFLWALRNDNISNNMDKSRDYVVLIAMSTLILLPAIYSNIILLSF